jgi:hypothetical protein
MRGISIVNENRVFPRETALTDPMVLDPILDEIFSLNNRIIAIIAPGTWAVVVLDAILSRGITGGEYVFLSSYWMETTVLKQEDRMDLVVGGLQMTPASWYQETGEHVKSEIPRVYANNYIFWACYYYDATMLAANAIQSGLVLGFEFEE